MWNRIRTAKGINYSLDAGIPSAAKSNNNKNSETRRRDGVSKQSGQNKDEGMINIQFVSSILLLFGVCFPAENSWSEWELWREPLAALSLLGL